MADTTIFAWTEPTPPEGYPAYVNLKRTDDGKCYITVRSRGNGGRDRGCVEVSPETLESLQCDLCEWLYREDTDRLMAALEAEVDAELRRLGIDPAEAERQGKAAVEGALETIRAHKAGVMASAPTDASLDEMWRETEGENVHYRAFARLLLARTEGPEMNLDELETLAKDASDNASILIDVAGVRALIAVARAAQASIDAGAKVTTAEDDSEEWAEAMAEATMAGIALRKALAALTKETP